MTFYLRPPEGSVPVHLFQLYAESRLRFLIDLATAPTLPIDELLRVNALRVPRLDAVISASSVDRLAHFALRTITLLDPNMLHFVQKWELELFRRRLWTSASAKELDLAARQLLRHLRHFLPFLESRPTDSALEAQVVKGHLQFLKASFSVLMTILRMRMLACLDNFPGKMSPGECPKHRSSTVLAIPFTQVLCLVRARDVALVKGQAQLQCHQIFQHFLEVLFSRILETSTDLLKFTALSHLKGDPRLEEACAALRRIFNAHGYYFPTPGPMSLGTAVATGEALTYDLLLNSVQKFPPCMASAFRSLRTNHRLCHQARVQLTLFLKSIFVPVEVTLRLLQEEYSQAPLTASSSAHACNHSWLKDSKRYIYGTRHLYGLEGSRKDYSVHSCSQIQTSSSSCGGCPFVASRGAQLCILSSDLGSESSATQFMRRGEQQPSPIESCHEYLHWKRRTLGMGKVMERHQSETRDQREDYPNEHHPPLKGTISKPTHFYNIINKL